MLKLFISSLLLYFLISRVETERLFGLIKEMNLFIFLAASFLYVIATYISSIRWKILTFSSLSTGKLFSLYMMGSFFNTILPGIIGGDAVKAYYLYRETGNPGISMASVFMDRYVGFISIMLIALLAFPFGLVYIRGSELEYLLPVIIFAFIIASILLFKLRIGERFRLLKEFYGFFDLYRDFNKSADIFLKSLLLSAIIQLMNMVAVYIISTGLGIKVSFISILLFIPLIVTVSMVPVSISGLGVREAGFVILFGRAGVRPEAAMSLSLLWFFSVVVGSLPGLLFYAINVNRERGKEK